MVSSKRVCNRAACCVKLWTFIFILHCASSAGAARVAENNDDDFSDPYTAGTMDDGDSSRRDSPLRGGHNSREGNEGMAEEPRATQTKTTSSQPQRKQQEEQTPMPDEIQQEENEQKTAWKNEQTCRSDGSSSFPFQGRDSAERLLLREGVIADLPDSRCGNPGRKNVILAIGDGMGYEMARAGAIAKQVLEELASLGCDTTVGCPDNEQAKAAFQGRDLSYYYTEGKGSGLSFQNLTGYNLVTTSAVAIGEPLRGNHPAPSRSMLGDVGKHGTGMGPLTLNECGFPMDFNPKDISEGGNMVLWDDSKGGMYPWHDSYYTDTTTRDSSVTAKKVSEIGEVSNKVTLVFELEEPTQATSSPTQTTSTSTFQPTQATSTSTSQPTQNPSLPTLVTATVPPTLATSLPTQVTSSPSQVTSLPTQAAPSSTPITSPPTQATPPPVQGTPTNSSFDNTYIMMHSTDSAATATTLASGQKVANKMVGMNLYEEEVQSILETAMTCGMAGGVVTAVPILHATPAAFISHSNDRTNAEQLRRGFRQVQPTLAMGTCADDLFPFESDLESMRNGPWSSLWTLFETKTNMTAENFFDGIAALHPDNDHVVACLGNKKILPYRGVDSSYSSRWCTRGTIETDNQSRPIGVTPKRKICDKNGNAERDDQIPHIATTVKAAIDFLRKKDEGMFMIYEQGDIDVAAHANHMDDMLGTILDFDDSVAVIKEFIAENGGWEKNALYVTADHDHYLTLLPQFPEVLANLLIEGESYNITPASYSNRNPWELAMKAGRHNEITPNTTQVDHLRDFSTWSEEDVDNVGHFWGPRLAGGNGWASHSTRPVPVYHQGDDGCIEALLGKNYSVLGREVQGTPGKIDQVHLHACMVKSLFGY